MLDETTTVQKLAAELIGTAFLVFIGVGSVPATLIVNGNAPFTMADLGMISLAFGTIVIATVCLTARSHRAIASSARLASIVGTNVRSGPTANFTRPWCSWPRSGGRRATASS